MDNLVSTGHYQSQDSETGLAIPLSVFKLESELNEQISIEYVDINKNKIGPFLFNFNAEEEYLKSSKNVLVNNVEWVHFERRLNLIKKDKEWMGNEA